MRTLVAAAALLMSVSAGGAQELLLFGGDNRSEFLGCLTCSEFRSDSICNEFGHGSQFRSESIFNEFGRFGSQFSSSSPWNQFSSSDEVPVLVDRDGGFYGYFTINQFRSDAVDFTDELANLYEMAGGDLEVVRSILCKQLHG